MTGQTALGGVTGDDEFDTRIVECFESGDEDGRNMATTHDAETGGGTIGSSIKEVRGHVDSDGDSRYITGKGSGVGIKREIGIRGGAPPDNAILLDDGKGAELGRPERIWVHRVSFSDISGGVDAVVERDKDTVVSCTIIERYERGGIEVTRTIGARERRIAHRASEDDGRVAIVAKVDIV
jgi:hypothetical protein